MPAFTFEKIAPPPRRGSLASQSQPKPQASDSSQSRGTVIQVLGRFVEARVQEDGWFDQPPPRRPLPK